MKELFYTKDSKISGRGNFALSFIPKMTNLGLGLVKENNTGNDDCDYKRFPICTFTNHSNNPNLFFKKDNNKYYFYTLRDIDKEEELTIDYLKFDFEGKIKFLN